MYFEGKCKEIDRIVATDPSLGAENGGRYVRYGIEGFDWLAKGVVCDLERLLSGGRTVPFKKFVLVLHDPDVIVHLNSDGSLQLPGNALYRKVQVFSPADAVALGANDVADEIMSCGEDLDRNCCLSCAYPGSFGVVQEGHVDGDVKLVVVNGKVGGFYGNSQENLKNYLFNAFQIDLEMSFFVEYEVLWAAAKRMKERRDKKERE